MKILNINEKHPHGHNLEFTFTIQGGNLVIHAKEKLETSNIHIPEEVKKELKSFLENE